MAAEEEYNPSYRQTSVDDTLDEHDERITRLEKAALIAFGYGLANGSDFAHALQSLI